MRYLFQTFAFLLLALSLNAHAQQQARLRGEILDFSDSTLTVKSGEGETVSVVKLRDNTPITLVQNATLADIKPGFFVGAAAEPQANGQLTALEVHIFPESLRGTGEGHALIDQGNTMTNATVESLVSDVSGKTLKLQYRGGDKEIVIPDGIPIVILSASDRSIIKKGTRIFAPVVQQPDSAWFANRVFAGADDVVPPM